MDNKYEIEYEQDYEKYYFEYRDKYKKDTLIINSIRKLEYEKNKLVKFKEKNKIKINNPSESIPVLALLISLLSLGEQVGTSDNIQGGIALFIIIYITVGIVCRQLNNKKYNKIIKRIDDKLNLIELRIIVLKNLLYEKYKIIV